MTDADEWGRDPAVRGMRRIFRAMDAAQGSLISRMGIYRYDPRIRPWREKALVLFEKAFSSAHGLGVEFNEEDASNIYLHCLATAMRTQGIEIPDAYLPDPMLAEE